MVGCLSDKLQPLRNIDEKKLTSGVEVGEPESSRKQSSIFANSMTSSVQEKQTSVMTAECILHTPTQSAEWTTARSTLTVESQGSQIKFVSPLEEITVNPELDVSGLFEEKYEKVPTSPVLFPEQVLYPGFVTPSLLSREKSSQEL